MTKPQLIDMIAKKTGMKKKDAASCTDAVLDAITETLEHGQQLSLVGFGTFDIRKRSERIGRNPRTGEKMTIPESSSCIFRPGRKLREAIKG